MPAKLTQFRKVAPASLEKRAEPRQRVAVSRATVRAHGERAATAQLHDLSIYGCRIHTPRPHDAGERVWLRFAGTLPIPATVVWSDGGFAGCRFDAPIARVLMRSLTLTIS